MNERVRHFLIDLARQRLNQTITYQKLADACELQLNMRDNPFDRKKMGVILGEISRYENDSKRPLLSSLVLRAGDNYEGDGFYKLSEELGFGDWKKLKREGTFEIEQLTKCIEFWQDNDNYRKFR